MLAVKITTVATFSAILGHAQIMTPFGPADSITMKGATREKVDFIWNEAISDANATSKTIKIKGPSLDEKDLGLVDWEASVAIVGAYEVTNITNDGLNYLTGNEVSFKAPFKKQPEYWTTCIGVAFIDSDDKEDVDISCRGSLSNECRNALSEWVESSGLCQGLPEPPEECKKEIVADIYEDFRGPKGPNVALSVEADLSSPNDFRKYDRLTKGIYVSMMQSVIKDEGKSASEWIWGPGSFSCLRATEIKNGSRVPEWPEKVNKDKDEDEDEEKDKPDEGAASSLRLGAGSMLALVLASAAVLSL